MTGAIRGGLKCHPFIFLFNAKEFLTAHPYKKAAHRNDPKWLGGLRKGYDKGGPVTGYAGVKQLDDDPSGESQVTPAEMMSDARERNYDPKDYPTKSDFAPTPQNVKNDQWEQATRTGHYNADGSLRRKRGGRAK